MKFNDNTISVLKNFSEINPSILFKEGSVLRTISPQKTVMAKATLSDSFPSNAAVFDLSRFLATVSLVDDPDIVFEADRFMISQNQSKIAYTFAAENMIITPPEKDIEIPSIVASVDVSHSVLSGVIRAAGVLSVSDIAFKSDGKNLTLSAIDNKNPNSDTFVQDLENTEELEEFNILIKVDNLKLLPGDYTISLSSAGIAHFKGKDVEYWIAAEAS